MQCSGVSYNVLPRVCRGRVDVVDDWRHVACRSRYFQRSAGCCHAEELAKFAHAADFDVDEVLVISGVGFEACCKSFRLWRSPNAEEKVDETSRGVR